MKLILNIILWFQLAAVCLSMREVVCRQHTYFCELSKQCVAFYAKETKSKNLLNANPWDCRVSSNCDSKLVAEYTKEFVTFSKELMTVAALAKEIKELDKNVKTAAAKKQFSTNLANADFEKRRQTYLKMLQIKYDSQYACRMNVMICQAATKVLDMGYQAEMKCVVRLYSGDKQKKMVKELKAYRDSFTSSRDYCDGMELCAKEDKKAFLEEYAAFSKELVANKLYSDFNTKTWPAFQSTMYQAEKLNNKCASAREEFIPLYNEYVDIVISCHVKLWSQFRKLSEDYREN